MIVQDFFSVVQLGIGLHAGTALLQVSAELGAVPLERRLNMLEEQVKELDPSRQNYEDIFEELKDIKSNWAIYNIRQYNTYRKMVVSTFVCAGLLTMILAVLSFLASAEISMIWGILLVGVSLAPAAVIFCYFWEKMQTALNPIEVRLVEFEKLLVDAS